MRKSNQNKMAALMLFILIEAAVALSCDLKPRHSNARAVDAGSRIAVGRSPAALVIADFNSDGKPDLATDDWQNNRITVVFNDGRGGFLSPGVSFPVGKMPYYKLRAADLNKDGRADLVTTNFEGGNVTILLADGKGT